MRVIMERNGCGRRRLRVDPLAGELRAGPALALRGWSARLPLRLLPTLGRVLGAGRGAVRRAHPAAAHGRQSAFFEAAKEQIS